MSIGKERVALALSKLRGRLGPGEVAVRLAPKSAEQRAFKPAIRPTKRITARSLDAAWAVLLGHTAARDGDRQAVADPGTVADLGRYERNIESCVGLVRIPLGVVGPLRVNGIFAQDDFYVPLATTEAALVASYARGARLVNDAGGCSATLLHSGLVRTPCFSFDSIASLGLFVNWLSDRHGELCDVAAGTSRHCRLIDQQVHVDGRHAYLGFVYETGDAAGQNMVTIATEAVCAHIAERSPVRPAGWIVESNFSGDKKASAMSFASVRGSKVTAEVSIPDALVRKHLHVGAGRMHEVWLNSALGAVMSGTIGIQAHYANGLAALYLACGQDVACIAESSVGITRIQAEGDMLRASVTLPSVVVGTVGGGTGLPTQQAGLNILGLAGEGNAPAFAEVCAALCLAGELSLTGAISAGHFASAHQRLARAR